MTNLKRPTIKEVAIQSGVSVQTVSRVINNRPDVAPDTRLKVQEVIQVLGYQPNALARSLIQQRTNTLGVVTNNLNFIGVSRTLNGITHMAEELGYALQLKSFHAFKPEEVAEVLNDLLSHQVEGIVWAMPEIGNNRLWLDQECPDLPVPMVFLTMQVRPCLPVINFDNLAGGRMAVNHLLQQGYRHIAHISGPLDWWESRQRKLGWETALQENGMMVNDSHWAEGDWSASCGAAVYQHLKESYAQMDAVFVANDQMALGVLQAARNSGIDIPGSLGLVGFDGLPESAFSVPPLTTVFQDQSALGSLAVTQLHEMIETQRSGRLKPFTEPVWLNPELIIRHSSQKPQAVYLGSGIPQTANHK
jgi:LacI family transcriptional regulator